MEGLAGVLGGAGEGVGEVVGGARLVVLGGIRLIIECVFVFILWERLFCVWFASGGPVGSGGVERRQKHIIYIIYIYMYVCVYPARTWLPSTVMGPSRW